MKVSIQQYDQNRKPGLINVGIVSQWKRIPVVIMNGTCVRDTPKLLQARLVISERHIHAKGIGKIHINLDHAHKVN